MCSASDDVYIVYRLAQDRSDGPSVLKCSWFASEMKILGALDVFVTGTGASIVYVMYTSGIPGLAFRITATVRAVNGAASNGSLATETLVMSRQAAAGSSTPMISAPHRSLPPFHFLNFLPGNFRAIRDSRMGEVLPRNARANSRRTICLRMWSECGSSALITFVRRAHRSDPIAQAQSGRIRKRTRRRTQLATVGSMRGPRHAIADVPALNAERRSS